MDQLNPMELLTQWREGNRSALDALFPLVYDDLRVRAHHLLEGQGTGATLSTTALVHESYLSLLRNEALTWEDRAHFLALAARAMRFVLVDYARRHGARKRGANQLPIELNEEIALPDSRADQMIALDDALNELAARNERLSRTVELRFFGGLTIEETAEALGVVPSTVKLDWQKARAWLYRELSR